MLPFWVKEEIEKEKNKDKFVPESLYIEDFVYNIIETVEEDPEDKSIVIMQM